MLLPTPFTSLLAEGDKIGEPKLSVDKAENKSHGREIGCELFSVTGKNLDYIDIDSMFDDDKMVINKLPQNFVWLFCQACTYRALLKGYENICAP